MYVICKLYAVPICCIYRQIDICMLYNVHIDRKIYVCCVKMDRQIDKRFVCYMHYVVNIDRKIDVWINRQIYDMFIVYMDRKIDVRGKHGQKDIDV